MKNVLIMLIMFCLVCCSNIETVGDDVVNSSDSPTMNYDSVLAFVLDKDKPTKKIAHYILMIR